MKKVFFLSSIVIVVVLAIFFSNPLNRIVVFDPINTAEVSGYVLIAEEDSLASSRTKLAELGLTEIGEPPTARCANHFNEAATDVILFRDLTWRRGVFCVFIQGDRIIDLSWWFDPTAP